MQTGEQNQAEERDEHLAILTEALDELAMSPAEMLLFVNHLLGAISHEVPEDAWLGAIDRAADWMRSWRARPL